jgi:predicted regulator of Ras-like GTPase activity (Roadblock/LC7/MglB family)
MSNEIYTFALKSTMDEIQKACPDVTRNFVFKDGKIIAQSENTTEEDATQTVTAFDAITERADAIGDVETITIQSAEGKVNIANMNDFYVTTVSSKEADEKYVNTLTRILIPIVIKLADKIQPASISENETITLDQPEPEPEEDAADEATEEAPKETLEETADETEEAEETSQPEYEEEEEETSPSEPEQAEPEPEYNDEPLLPEPPATQLIVENLKGFRVPSDTVRFDQEVIQHWNELYGDIKINEVEVEALNGKTTRCKFKNIKKSKDAGRGIIKMPEKIQLALETQEGELVTVKPVVE